MTASLFTGSCRDKTCHRGHPGYSSGCPWDLRQSYATIVPYTLEEAYEVADAIQRGQDAAPCRELDAQIAHLEHGVSHA